MWAGGLDGGYRGLLATGFGFYVRMEVWQGGVRVDTYGSSGLPKLDGSLSATLGNRVSRTLSFTVDGSFMPVDPNDPAWLLSPLNKEIRAFAVYDDGLYEFPIFRGRIQTFDYNSDAASIALTAADRAQDVLDDNFANPRNSLAGIAADEQYVLLVNETLPDANFFGFDIFYANIPKLTWDNDRGQACDDCANACNALWYALPDGRFTLKKIPWTQNATPIVTLINGFGGVMVGYSVSGSRQDVYNRIIMTGERADNSDPVHALVEDRLPSSPTWVKGNFGSRSQLVQVQSATNQGQALLLGQQYLLASRSFRQTWGATMPIDAALELGDTVTCQDRVGRQSTQVVSTFNFPIMGSDLMSVGFRSLIPDGGKDIQ